MPAPRIVAWARILSLIGHPALVVPVGVAWDAHRRGGSMGWVLTAGGVAAILALGIGLDSWRRVRRGDWVDADASRPEERRQLQRILLPVLAVPAGLLAMAGAPRHWVVGFVAGAALVAVAQALRRWQKMSLHVAFGMFALARFWPAPAGIAGTSLVLAVAVSRVVLRRHTWVEVVTGGIFGALAAWAVQSC